MSILTPILVIWLVTIASYTILEKNFPAWEERGFHPFKGEWLTIFIGGGIVASVIATLTWVIRDHNVLSASFVGLFTLFGAIAAYTDSIIRKAPLELLHLMCYVGLACMITVVFAAPNDVVQSMNPANELYMRVPLEAFLTNLGFGLVLLLAGFLGFVKIPGYGIAKISLFIGQLGAFIMVYTPLSYFAFSNNVGYWSEVAHALIPYLIVLSVIWVFSWMVGDMIGGADISIMYAVGLILTPVSGAGVALAAIVVATLLQGIVHLLGEKAHYGAKRSIKNGKISQLFENRKAKRQGRTPETHKMRTAMPFIPVLVGTIVFMCATMNTLPNIY